MKISLVLPVFAFSADKRHKQQDRDRSVETFVASNFTEQCSTEVSIFGGIFESANSGFNGEIALQNYGADTKCKHVIQADSSCQEIKINYQSVAVESELDCDFDYFRFGWTGETGFEVTPPRCHCFGDGCQSMAIAYDLVDYYSVTDDYVDNYTFDNFTQFEIGGDGLVINSNSFTFFFESDFTIDGGHVMFDWECVKM